MRRISYKTNRYAGSTLIEMLLVIAIIGLFAVVPLVSLQRSKSDLILRTGQATVLQALETARNRSSSGVGGVQHGVRVESDRIILFVGPAYPGTGNTFQLPPAVTTNATGTDIVFDRISGRTHATNTIIMTGPGGATSSITVTDNGFIQ